MKSSFALIENKFTQKHFQLSSRHADKVFFFFFKYTAFAYCIRHPQDQQKAPNCPTLCVLFNETLLMCTFFG